MRNNYSRESTNCIERCCCLANLERCSNKNPCEESNFSSSPSLSWLVLLNLKSGKLCRHFCILVYPYTPVSLLNKLRIADQSSRIRSSSIANSPLHASLFVLFASSWLIYKHRNQNLPLLAQKTIQQICTKGKLPLFSVPRIKVCSF